MPKYIFFSHDKDNVNDYKQILNNVKLDCDFFVISFDDIIDKYYKKVPIAIVSPANSYGNMKGGIDRRIIKIFPHVEKDVIKCIGDSNFYDSTGKAILPVGQCLHIPIDTAGNVLIICPTMETPRNIEGTNNIEKAFIALYDYTKDLPKSAHILVPCLGTGIGGMSGRESAIQICNVLKNLKI